MVKANRINRKDVETAYWHLSLSQLIDQAQCIYNELDDVVILNLDRIPQEFVDYCFALTEAYREGYLRAIHPCNLSMAYVIHKHPWEANDYYIDNGVFKRKINWRFFYS